MFKCVVIPTAFITYCTVLYCTWYTKRRVKYETFRSQTFALQTPPTRNQTRSIDRTFNCCLGVVGSTQTTSGCRIEYFRCQDDCKLVNSDLLPPVSWSHEFERDLKQENIEKGRPTRLARPKFSGANGDREMFIFLFS